MSRYDDEYYDDVERSLRRRYSDDDYYDSREERNRRPRGRRLSKKERARLEKERKQKIRLKKRKRRIRIIFTVVLCLFFLVIFLLFTKPGHNFILRLASRYVKSTVRQDDTVSFEKPKTVPKGWVYDENVINVLLVGIERNGGAANTDSMIIVSQDLKTGKITLVSLLRDTYVDISGLNVKRKLNYAYSHGDGMKTLIDTIQNTYHVFINAYMSVDYDSFENIIDMLGGVSVEISEKEADYLNTTNYISNPSNRNLSSGTVKMNGNQALGYCRVRKVPTVEGVNNDYGRTLRQRKVLSSLFDKYKSQKFTDILSTTNSVLKSVTTNISSDDIYNMLKAYTDHRTDSLNQLMIPAEGKFSPENVDGVGAVLSIDGFEEENIRILQQALYGKSAV